MIPPIGPPGADAANTSVTRLAARATVATEVFVLDSALGGPDSGLREIGPGVANVARSSSRARPRPLQRASGRAAEPVARAPTTLKPPCALARAPIRHGRAAR
jgi:hypothetical protein